MRRVSWLLVGSSLALIFGCEPLDAGGGGGVGGKVAFVRSSRLLVSGDDGLGTNEVFLTEATGNAAEPTLSSNGANVAFAFSDTGNADSRGIWLVPAAGGTPTVLAAPAAADESFGSPTFSRDDASVVFVKEKAGERTLWKVATAGGDPEAVAAGVTDVNFPAFIDANTLLVLKGLDSLQKLDLTTGALTALDVSTPSRGAVDSTGTRIAFSKNNGIVVMDLATKAETPLPASGGGDVKPAFSPGEGAFVAFESAGKLYQTKSDGSSVIEPLQSGTDVAWSP